MTPKEPLQAVEERLLALQDERYREFHRRLVPTAPPDYIVGVRMPQLRRLAREVDAEALLAALPHRYYEENQLHAIILAGMKDYRRCLAEVDRFLPYVDNWATCDALRPRCFRQHLDEVEHHIALWLASRHEYTVRFGIGILEAFFLDKAFQPGHLRQVAEIGREEYYIKMMQAWYYATALAKQWEATLPVLDRLEPWIRCKTIQKACESFRVPQAHKEILRTLR